MISLKRFLIKKVAAWANKDASVAKSFVDYAKLPELDVIQHRGEENPGKIVYEICEVGHRYGFFAEVHGLIHQLYYAEQMGYEPSVKFGKEFAYFDESIKDTTNAFEYYFVLTSGVLDASHSANAIKSRQCCEILVGRKYTNVNYNYSDEYLTAMAEIYNKYISIRGDLMVEFDAQIQSMFGDVNKVLGIHYRGTDYKKGYQGHPLMVQVAQVIDEAKNAIAEYGFDKIFIATDEKGISDQFKSVFGENMIVTYADVFRGDAETSVAFSESERLHHKYLLGKEVLRDAYTLSQCDGFISGMSQVSFSARLFKRALGKVYSYDKIIDNGISKSRETFW